MAHAAGKPKKPRHHLTPGQKLSLTAALVIVLALCSTVFLNFRAERLAKDDFNADGTPNWPDAVTVFVSGTENDYAAPFYNEGLAEVGRYSRGTRILLENWEPFVTESNNEYYHAFLDGMVGYIPCQNVTTDQAELLTETELYVRSTVHLMQQFDDLAIGPLVQQGTLLRVVGYDYFKADGAVNMYYIKMGDQFGWIKSEYVVTNYTDAMTHWKEEEVYQASHVFRGDGFGGGDAGGLDYWPHEKGDFAAEGNVMPQDVYAMYIPTTHLTTETVPQYLDAAKDTEINAFVVNLWDNSYLAQSYLAYDSPWLEKYGLLDEYNVINTVEECTKAIRLLQDAGYYVIGRMSVFQDAPLAQARPDWAITDNIGRPVQIGDFYWPSAYCRELWEMKVGFAVEAADLFGLNEIQFDYVRFPDYLNNTVAKGDIDLKNTYGESRAQAVQRFLTYATDVLHSHNVYVACNMMGETSNYYVAPFGQYWPAESDVVDVICGMPYPDSFSSFLVNREWIIPSKRPYYMMNQFGLAVHTRQSECASPAIVRTWMQTWNVGSYTYDSETVKREIVAVYDADEPGGYMLWYSDGSLSIIDKLKDAVSIDYRTLYDEALEEGLYLHEYMGLSTSDTQQTEE